MAIATGAAILGAAVIGGGASYLASKSASSKAADASNYAADQNAAVSREIYNQTRTDLAPYNQAGQGALAALMTRMGLSPIPASGPGSNLAPRTPAAQPASAGGTPKIAGGFAGTSPMEGSPVAGKDAAREVGRLEPGNIAGTAVPALAPPAGAPQAGGQPDWNAYLAANPDVAAQAQAEGRNPVEYAQQHYQVFGQSEGRELPTSGGQPGGPADPNAPPPQYYEEQYAQRPDALQMPTYQRQADMSAPGAFSYTPQDIENDVGYRFARDEALGGVNASFAARNKLRSGDAMKALLARGAGVAHQWDNDYFSRALQTHNVNTDAYRYGQDRQDRNFLDDRSYGTNLTLTNQGRNDNIFSEDRGFTAGRNDQATANLFGLVGAGQNAAAGTASAGNVFASNTINSNNQRANTTANSAIANAQNVSNLFGSAANAVGTYYGMRGRY
jgi:hypothetical protein